MTDKQVKIIKELYTFHCAMRSFNPHNKHNSDAIQAIIQVLNILDLKIRGINA